MIYRKSNLKLDLTLVKLPSCNNVSAQSFGDISNDDLDSVVCEIKLFYPNLGSKNLVGHIASRNITFQGHGQRFS